MRCRPPVKPIVRDGESAVCTDVCRSADLPLMFAFAAHHLGVAYARAGRYTEALALLEQKAGQTGSFQALALVRLGEAYALTGRDVDAASVARQALERARADQQRASEADALHLIATIASHREPPDPDVAAAYYAQALALAKPRGMRPLVAHCHFGLATLYRRMISKRKRENV